MKISINNLSNYRPAPKEITKANSGVCRSQNSHNFDGITIQTNSILSPEKAFQNQLVQKLSLEVRQPASEKKIEDLKEQIARGTYEIDINAIADRIMLF